MRIRNNKQENLLNVKCYLLSEDQGFTLIELIVVMAIIAIISGTIWGNFLPSLTKGRDSKRKQSLESVSKALELYFLDNGSYPNPTYPLPEWGQPLVHPESDSVIYMQRLPQDPSSNYSYCYNSDNKGTYYKLYAKLENNQDPAIFSPVDPSVLCAGSYCQPENCNNQYNNYGVSSTNTTP